MEHRTGAASSRRNDGSQGRERKKVRVFKNQGEGRERGYRDEENNKVLNGSIQCYHHIIQTYTPPW